ncbi:MAG TPA: DUF3616 domain-containing protein, partial [Rhodospirillales bacterium]|nr:DUF3616 domain-containing protein [Rhodospirillales bacterium]
MTEGYLLGRVLLRFGAGVDAESIIGELSAAAFDANGALWVASDELSSGRITLSRLQPDGHGAFGHHVQFELRDCLELLADGEDKTEADIEGLDIADHYLWFTGSHASKRSRPKGKSREKDLARLARIEVEANRFLLGRIPLLGGTPARSGPHPDHAQVRLNAARLADGAGGNVLIEALRDDPHLGPFLRTVHGDDGTETVLPLASKENGFDIEGLTVLGKRVFLGLRGPVLHGWATLLEIEPRDDVPGRLGLAPISGGQGLYRKHFLDLGGLGIRELARDGDDLLILAGPTMTLPGTLRVYRLRDARDLAHDSLTGAGDRQLQPLFEIPTVADGDNAEGFALYPWPERQGLLVVYDGPVESRRP